MKKKEFAVAIIAFFMSVTADAQKPNWQNLDLKQDTVFGISTEKAYQELLAGKKAVPVTVAVIDMGIDTMHEDLRPVMWTNLREIPGNGIDDDSNGYIDDVYGWNFSHNDNAWDDLIKLTLEKKALYDSLSYTRIPETELKGYRTNRRLITTCKEQRQLVSKILNTLALNKEILENIVRNTGKTNPGLADFKSYQAQEEAEKIICRHVIHFLPKYKDYFQYRQEVADKPIDILKSQLNNRLNIEYKSQDIDSKSWKSDNDVNGPFYLLADSGPYHGTSVSGIIAADRNNNLGIKGVADHVQIMTLRLISFFQDMRDIDLAAAIYYAADNGARIINMSFEREYAADKPTVDKAIRYAMKKDVLIIVASGNDGKDIESVPHHPDRKYQDTIGEAPAWINVGASGWKDDSSLLAGFSNYGKTTVDVFAPGVQMISCVPGSQYKPGDGTSIAAPIVAGLAALIREYYPALTALQVKDIIMQTVVKRDILKDKCVTGGIVNAYNALKLAATYK